MGKPPHRHELQPDSEWPGPPPSQPDEKLAAAGYIGAMIIVPIVPLAIVLTRRHGSPYVRTHAVQALNVCLTCLLYAVCGAIIGGLLAIDSVLTAVSITLAMFAAGWGIMVTQLARAARAARSGAFRQIPNWICAPLVR